MKTYSVLPEIEVFDLSHILKAKAMADAGAIPALPYIQFVMGEKRHASGSGGF